MVVGVPSSGKSVLAKELARELINASYISKDLVQTPFTGKERVGDTYSFIQGPTFNILCSFADTQLSHDKIPIIDAPFSINHRRDDAYRDWIPPFRDVAKNNDARLAIIRCVPPSEEELRRRIEKRVEEGTHPWDQGKLSNWDTFLEQEPIYFPIDHDDVREVVSDKLVKDIVTTVLIDYLRASHYLYL